MNEPHLVHGIFTTRVKTSQGQLPETILIYTLQVRNRLENKGPSQITPGKSNGQVNQTAALLGLTIKIGQTADPGSQITLVGAEICITKARLCLCFMLFLGLLAYALHWQRTTFWKLKPYPDEEELGRVFSVCLCGLLKKQCVLRPGSWREQGISRRNSEVTLRDTDSEHRGLATSSHGRPLPKCQPWYLKVLNSFIKKRASIPSQLISQCL